MQLRTEEENQAVPHQEKTCLRTCAKCTDLDSYRAYAVASWHVQSYILQCQINYVIPQDTFSHDVAQSVLLCKLALPFVVRDGAAS